MRLPVSPYPQIYIIRSKTRKISDIKFLHQGSVTKIHRVCQFHHRCKCNGIKGSRTPWSVLYVTVCFDFKTLVLLRIPLTPVIPTSDIVTIKLKISISIIPDIVNLNERFSVTSKFSSIEKQERAKIIRLNRDKY